MGEKLTLNDGARIAIIGGGPAGSFFAHFMQKLALKKGISLSLTIFDGKDFLQKGPRGCNLCAGVIAESLSIKLKEEGIHLPEKRIVNRVDGYILHVGKEQIYLSCEENEVNPIATVYRGNGPRYSMFPDIISFDDFLLSWAQDRGVEVIAQPVKNIILPEDKNKPLSLYYGKQKDLHQFDADLVVGAFGVNSFLIKKIEELGFGYKPPKTLVTFQAELKLGRKTIQKKFGNSIHVHMPQSSSLRFATVIPKGDYLTISLIGRKDVTKEMYSEFLQFNGIRDKIPPLKPHCFCYPKILLSPSRKPFTDRLVLIGDSSFSRHYKNGIESAFITAKLAAEAALHQGIDMDSFSSYYKQAKDLIIKDNAYGRFLFFLNDIISSLPLLAQSHLTLARRTNKSGSSRRLRCILWNMFTGNIPYREIFKNTLNLKLQVSLSLHTIGILFQNIKNIARLKKKLS